MIKYILGGSNHRSKISDWSWMHEQIWIFSPTQVGIPASFESFFWDTENTENHFVLLENWRETMAYLYFRKVICIFHHLRPGLGNLDIFQKSQVQIILPRSSVSLLSFPFSLLMLLYAFQVWHLFTLLFFLQVVVYIFSPLFHLFKVESEIRFWRMSQSQILQMHCLYSHLRSRKSKPLDA